MNQPHSLAARPSPPAPGGFTFAGLVPGWPPQERGGSSTVPLIVAAIVLAAINLIQVLLRAEFLVLLIADATLIFSLVLLGLAPRRIGSWFTLIQVAQLFGLALLFKTIMLEPFDSGLLRPVASISLCSAAIVLTGLSTFTQGSRGTRDYKLAKYYGDPGNWRAAGLLLLALGESATWLNYLVNSSGLGVSTFGGFNPLVHFKIAGVALLANEAMRRGKLLSRPLVFALGLAGIEALIFNSKGEAAFRFAAYGLALFVQPIAWRKKVFAVLACAAGIGFADRIVFPMIHVLRTDEFRESSIGERVDLIIGAFSGTRYSWRDLRMEESNTIIDDYIQFLSTDDGFVNRFGSLGYIDLTVALGDPEVTRQPLIPFLADTAKLVLPARFSPAKDRLSFADKIWATIDSRFAIGSFATMGTIASSRMVFGTWEGIAIVVMGLWAVLFLWQTWYGSDIQTPLLQFLLIDSVAGLIDGDVQGLFLYLMRFFWQDLLIVGIAGYFVLRLRRGRLPRLGAAVPR